MYSQFVSKPSPKHIMEAITSIRGILVLLETAPEEVEAISFNVSVVDGRRLGGEPDEQIYTYLLGEVDTLLEIQETSYEDLMAAAVKKEKF